MDKMALIKSQLELFFEVPILLWDGCMEMLAHFEDEHCLLPHTQACFKKESLQALLEQGGANTIFNPIDDLEMELAVFKVDDKWFLVGPFTSSGWDDKQSEIILATHGLPQSYFVAYKLYRCSYPIIDMTLFQQMLNAMVGALNKQKVSFSIYKITSNHRPNDIDVSEQLKDVSLDYAGIQRRYQAENKFIEMLQIGNTEGALKSWEKMGKMSDGLAVKLHGSTGALIGSAIFRTLVRQAVKNTGMHMATLHAISQKYMQRIHNENNPTTYKKWSKEFIIDICRAVRESSNEEYSLLIRQAIGYINLNLSETIGINEIADEVNLSVSHLSRLFKQETGENISNYVAKKRVEKACRLLTFTDLPIQEIGHYVGYLDNSYFVKVFKKHQQTSPSEYRKKHKA